jgi:hypothetical protein
VVENENKRRQKANRPRTESPEQREHRREYKRRWRAENAEKIARQKRAWRENNLEHDRERNRKYMRARNAEARAAETRRKQKAEQARDRYHANVEASRARAKELAARRREADPEKYHEDKRRYNQAWRDRRREEINARLRERNRLDPSQKAAAARRFYERHADEIRATRRRRYEENREKELARQRLWRQREKRRIDLGLPARRVHRLPLEERQQNITAADAFFNRPVTPELLAKVKADLRTPPELIEALKRDLARFRAEQYALHNPEVSSTVVNRRAVEEERMDAIGRVINDRLRLAPRRPEPVAYSPPQPEPSRGLGL